MGKEKYIRQVENLFKKSPVVSFSSISRIVRFKQYTKQYTKQLIRNLILKGKVKRLTKGYYTQHDEISLSVFCFKPSYLGLQDALSIHNLWEQEAVPVIITTKQIRPGIRRVMGSNILLRRINKKYLFGFEYKRVGDFYAPVSDIEKTFIDMVYFNEQLSEETRKNMIKNLNSKKLNSYLRVYPKKFRKRVLGCLE